MSLLGMMSEAVSIASFSMGNMNDFDLSAFKKLFVTTAGEYLAKIKGVIDGTISSEENTQLEQLHIAFHSLKSQSATMGFLQTAAYCGVIEIFLKSRIEQKQELTDVVRQVVTEACAVVRESISTIDTENREAITEQMVNTVKQKTEHL